MDSVRNEERAGAERASRSTAKTPPRLSRAPALPPGAPRPAALGPDSSDRRRPEPLGTKASRANLDRGGVGSHIDSHRTAPSLAQRAPFSAV